MSLGNPGKEGTMKSNRPRWAKPLTAKEWKHLTEGQNTSNPTLRKLKIDAACSCPDCKRILSKVTA